MQLFRSVEPRAALPLPSDLGRSDEEHANVTVIAEGRTDFAHAHVLSVAMTKRARGSAAWGQPLHSEVLRGNASPLRRCGEASDMMNKRSTLRRFRIHSP
jgi:hypothetical protein